jgi:dTDP-4-dehydrorhamnose reductase
VTRWLITGSKGQLGTDLQQLLADDDVTAVDLPELDITDEAATRSFVDGWLAGGGDCVLLNAAAYTAVDAAEEDEDVAHPVNAVAPGILARACASRALLVHVSTDYVFDGTATTPYDEETPPDPRSAYGRTKAAGERAVLDADPGAYVVRTAWVYGAGGNNFVKTMCRLERERDSIDVVDDQRGSPTWSRHLAQGLLDVARVRPAPGVYHCTGSGDTTWCGFTKAIFEELGADPGRVHPTTTDKFPRPAPRPAFSVLSDRRWREAGLPPMPHWRDALAEAFRTVGDAFRGEIRPIGDTAP